ncbi:MAG: [LysW]-aminoadipate/[LysW]-glutamate kinase [Ignisphaera sp.]|nr:[LysW]-aminoadipate/[LysW]-glutamate kinase [Ignisphaera sp.]MCX8167594.1 [LysW]-aminoadipate/[LysW]-glutamate kinase [Ignisphaera sp.]MDW8085414.1 [LysW]-aminoadipate/[LysW]-glutamate kinase [Ignisphaera sp.]
MTIIVKVGGRVLNNNIDSIVEDAVNLSKDRNVVLVHGGGDIVSEFCKKLGVEPKFVISPEGIRSRYTDERELEVYVMVMAGRINKSIVSKFKSLGCRAVGITGADGPTLLAERKKRIVVVDERGRKRVIDGGYTGRIISVNTELINILLEKKYVVIIAPIAVDDEGVLLNVDGDQAAYAIASALKVESLVILTDVDGVIIDNNIVREIRTSEISEIVKRIGPGMNRKVLMAEKALENGVGRIVIASGNISSPITNALRGGGTSIVKG